MTSQDVKGSARGGRRILVIDDTPSIHADFRKILCGGAASGTKRLDELEASLFGGAADGASVGAPQAQFEVPRATEEFLVDFVLQGREGLDRVQSMIRRKTPYALAFVDMRMPPGWDGVETTRRLWEADANLQIVICSAYSDYSWNDVTTRLNRPMLRLLHKPFDAKDVLDLAWSLTSKWQNVTRRA